MNPKKTIWVVTGGMAILTGYKAFRDGRDPIPQLVGIGTAGIILLFLSDPAPKVATGFAVLIGITYVLNWDYKGAPTPGGGAMPI